MCSRVRRGRHAFLSVITMMSKKYYCQPNTCIFQHLSLRTASRRGNLHERDAPHADMAAFPNRKFRSAADTNTFAARYRALMAKHPFLLFGLPFMSVMVAGSFVLTPATAIRYERHDRKVRQMTREEELSVGKTKRKVDIREEYYVSSLPAALCIVFSDVLIR
ncbi:cytochrome c oxidase assembly protein COX16-domain-containing protein [Diplogelasinospora grovesii]|uniref:Cytochrome c oxidase assembly protein COX16, mitochondrial n=1 Tax=Diplogelasinospora grovesii TaxID=303347 RepID=A0AAN6S0N1_9PEZI|nr:cytochrome c oxidase assembly protein COX16-domain-containing protein [Diplogelasinospora grovesii]